MRPSAHIDTGEERLVLWLRATPLGEHDQASYGFCRRMRTRMEVAGGALLASAGGGAGASFDAMELPDVIELAQGIVLDAPSEAPNLEVACAIALGPLQSSAQGVTHGAAIDRALLLAHRAEPGETVLDDAASQQAEPMYLFRRDLPASGVLGRVLDLVFDKRACRASVSRVLAAPWPSTAEPAYENLRARLMQPTGAAVVLSSTPAHLALDRIARARAELSPSLVLHATREASGLPPLGALSVALRRARQAIEALTLPEPHAATLTRLQSGAAVQRSEALAAMFVLMEAARAENPGEHALPWIVLERARELDSPSLLVVAELLANAAPIVVIATVEDGANLPPALSRSAALEKIAIDPLGEPARLSAAATALQLSPDDALASRVAELGGDSVLAIGEAARALVTCADVVHDGKRFRFRVADRRPAGVAPLEELIWARIAGLPNVAQRVLEAVCVCPLATDPDFARSVAALDGLPQDAIDAGEAHLAQEGLLDARGSLGPLETAVRAAVRAAMPPARGAELHRFVARLLRARCSKEPSFLHAVLAHHLAEGGSDAAASSALLDAAYAASSSGFDRIAVRLAALALKLDGSAEARARASQVATSVESTPLRDSTPDGEAREPVSVGDLQASPTADIGGDGPAPAAVAVVATDAVQAALAAIASRDVEAAENALDTAVAAGLGRAAASRLLSLAQLARGDLSESVKTLRRGRRHGASAKQALTGALILLEAGYELDAVRTALDALAQTRGAGDARGEQACLLVLAACYRRLGRTEDAERIDACASLAS